MRIDNVIIEESFRSGYTALVSCNNSACINWCTLDGGTLSFAIPRDHNIGAWGNDGGRGESSLSLASFVRDADVLAPGANGRFAGIARNVWFDIVGRAGQRNDGHPRRSGHAFGAAAATTTCEFAGRWRGTLPGRKAGVAPRSRR